MTKYCPYCGRQLAATDAFCPYCGKLQPANAPATAVTPPVAPAPEPPTPSPVEPSSFGSAMQPANLTAYRQALGYTAPDALWLYGFFMGRSWGIVTAIIAISSSNYYIVSFEPDGLLFLGIDLKTRFNGQNSFVNFQDIQNFRFTTGVMNCHLVADAPQGKIDVKIGKFLKGHPWQAANLKQLQHRYQS